MKTETEAEFRVPEFVPPELPEWATFVGKIGGTFKVHDTYGHAKNTLAQHAGPDGVMHWHNGVIYKRHPDRRWNPVLVVLEGDRLPWRTP